MNLDLKEIKELIALMRRNGLSEFELETEDFRIKLKKRLLQIGSCAKLLWTFQDS